MLLTTPPSYGDMLLVYITQVWVVWLKHWSSPIAALICYCVCVPYMETEIQREADLLQVTQLRSLVHSQR